MKAISLWQPWATLMAVGAKQCETRSWGTSHRGPLAIHAAKAPLPWMVDIIRADWQWWRDAFEKAGFEIEPERKLIGFGGLPRGCIIATVDLVSCTRTTAENAPPYPERAFGDYTPGRYHWHTANCKRLDTPIPFKGKQGFFNVPDELLQVPAAGVQPVGLFGGGP